MTGILNHLWQSSAFAAAIALAAWMMRRNSPRVRYWLWLAASVKFLVPFSWIVSTGARVAPPASAPVLKALPVETVATYFAPIPVPMNPVSGKTPFDWALWLGLVWLGGALILVARRAGQWMRLRRLTKNAWPVPGFFPVPLLESDQEVEPGVFGLLRPVILVPRGLAAMLRPQQLEAILRHELCHVRYRDNLTAALHMGVEAAFWFCPPVWWIGARLMEERERDCDAAALAQGANAGEYTRGILRVCERYVGSPLPCAAGIAGADLKKRVREIMSWRGARPVTLQAKLGLAIAAAMAVLVPLGIGIARAQSVPVPALHFEAASIKPAAPHADGSYFSVSSPSTFRVVNMPAAEIIAYAYQVKDFQVIGAPSWAKNVSFDITAATGIEPSDTSGSVNDKMRVMLQSLLTQRFALQLHRETRRLPILSLVAAAGGVKLAPSKCVPGEAATATTDRMAICGISGISRSAGSPNQVLVESGVRMGQLARTLSLITGREVVDNTGYTGTFDAHFAFAPVAPEAAGAPSGGAPPADASAPSLFTALQQQLGLKLKATRGPVEVLVIDKIQKPTAN